MSVLPGLELIVNPNLYFEAGVQVDLWGKNNKYNYTPILAAYLNLDLTPHR